MRTVSDGHALSCGLHRTAKLPPGHVHRLASESGVSQLSSRLPMPSRLHVHLSNRQIQLRSRVDMH